MYFVKLFFFKFNGQSPKRQLDDIEEKVFSYHLPNIYCVVYFFIFEMVTWVAIIPQVI